MSLIKLVPGNQRHISLLSTREAKHNIFLVLRSWSRPAVPLSVWDICESGSYGRPGCHVGCWSSQSSPELPLLCPATPGLALVRLLAIVEHPGPAGLLQDVPRYLTISWAAQVSVLGYINTCNGNEVTNIYLVKTQLPARLQSSPDRQIDVEKCQAFYWLCSTSRVLPDMSH